jgi:hypothetical protein
MTTALIIIGGMLPGNDEGPSPGGRRRDCPWVQETVCRVMVKKGLPDVPLRLVMGAA